MCIALPRPMGGAERLRAVGAVANFGGDTDRVQYQFEVGREHRTSNIELQNLKSFEVRSSRLDVRRFELF